jgi:hypothetical protein
LAALAGLAAQTAPASTRTADAEEVDANEAKRRRLTESTSAQAALAAAPAGEMQMSVGGAGGGSSSRQAGDLQTTSEEEAAMIANFMATAAQACTALTAQRFTTTSSAQIPQALHANTPANPTIQ